MFQISYKFPLGLGVSDLSYNAVADNSDNDIDDHKNAIYPVRTCSCMYIMLRLHCILLYNYNNTTQ